MARGLWLMAHGSWLGVGSGCCVAKPPRSGRVARWLAPFPHRPGVAVAPAPLAPPPKHLLLLAVLRTRGMREPEAAPTLLLLYLGGASTDTVYSTSKAGVATRSRAPLVQWPGLSPEEALGFRCHFCFPAPGVSSYGSLPAVCARGPASLYEIVSPPPTSFCVSPSLAALHLIDPTPQASCSTASCRHGCRSFHSRLPVSVVDLSRLAAESPLAGRETRRFQSRSSNLRLWERSVHSLILCLAEHIPNILATLHAIVRNPERAATASVLDRSSAANNFDFCTCAMFVKGRGFDQFTPQHC